MMNGFIERVERTTKSRVEVKQESHQRRVIDTRADKEPLHAHNPSDSASENRCSWVERMEQFRDAMLKVHEVILENNLEPPRVTVGFGFLVSQSNLY